MEPVPMWRRVHIPTLVVFGTADELVPAAVSAANIERGLRQGGNRHFSVRVFPAANHVLRRLPLVSSGPWDWPRAAPGYVDTTTAWLTEHL